MDIATVIGLFGGTVLIVSSVIIGGSALVFVNIPGILIVIGGTLATCFIKFSMRDVINSISVVMKAFMLKLDSPEELIKKLIDIENPGALYERDGFAGAFRGIEIALWVGNHPVFLTDKNIGQQQAAGFKVP